MTIDLSDQRLLSERSLPPYSYVPGLFPHPESDPQGHSFKVEHSRPVAPTESTWPACDDYLWGIDLFNNGYYWEAHESWEQVWHACGREGQIADFLKGLIKLAAAGVKAREGVAAGVERHARRAHELFDKVSETVGPNSLWMGLSLDELMKLARHIGAQPESIIDTSGEAVVRLRPFQLSIESSPCRSS